MIRYIYVVTLRKHSTGGIYRRCTFIEKIDAKIFYEKYKCNKKYYPSNIQYVEWEDIS